MDIHLLKYAMKLVYGASKLSFRVS